jgi:site-specific DNA-methyltransferase (adenine-specific)
VAGLLLTGVPLPLWREVKTIAQLFAKAPYHLHIGDCLAFLKALPSNSIDSIVTDPPGGGNFMGLPWDSDKGGREFWIKWLTKILVELLRVLKPGGHMIIWTCSRTSHWTRTALDDAGFEYVQTLIHIFATGKSHGRVVKSHARPEFNGFSTTVKTSCEEWVLVRKPLEGTVEANLEKWGVGALNVNACRVEGEPGQEPRMLGTIMHDGSDEVVHCFPEAPGQQAKLRADGAPMGNKVYGKMKHGNVAKLPRVDIDPLAARFFYCPKASKKDKNEGLANGEFNAHLTSKSVHLMCALVRLATPRKGIILDPFAGSSSTGKAAILEGFRFIGCDISAEFIKISEKRLKHAWRQSGGGSG